MVQGAQQVGDNFRGALWMLASGVTYSVVMALVKLLGDDYSSATFPGSASGFWSFCR